MRWEEPRWFRTAKNTLKPSNAYLGTLNDAWISQDNGSIEEEDDDDDEDGSIIENDDDGSIKNYECTNTVTESF